MEQRKEDEMYIRRCIQLAKHGRLNVSPNPMVGAVVVYNGRVIGEGYHVRCGQAHAEVNAIRSVKDPLLLKHSTIYVSLEPCSHHGKTPPCADLILEKEIPRIVVGCGDPSSKVSGRGIQKLRDAGREVKVGVLEQECRALIAPFVTASTLNRPYIILKWAESADGFLDIHRSGGTAVRLSTEESAMLVHKRRAEADAIIVGTRTAALDNPTLNVRHWHGNNPVRVVIDKNLSLPDDLRLFDSTIPTVVYTTKEVGAPENATSYITLDATQPLLPQITNSLHRQQIQTLLVEGGACLLQSFIDSNLWDEAWVEVSRKRIGEGVTAPNIPRRKRFTLHEYFGVSLLQFYGADEVI